MKYIIDYKVVEALSAEGLNKAVSVLIGYDWVPLGSLQVVSNNGVGVTFYQAMGKYRE